MAANSEAGARACACAAGRHAESGIRSPFRMQVKKDARISRRKLLISPRQKPGFAPVHFLLVADQLAAEATEDRWPARERRPLLLAAACGGSFNAAALRSHGTADRVAAVARRLESATGRRKPGETSRGDGEVSEDSRENRVNLPVGCIPTPFRQLPSGALDLPLRNSR
jgi:hypothetical protein